MQPKLGDQCAELLAVVDVDDCVVGAATRGEIHRLGLRHRAVHILVLNAGDDLYVQQRSWDKDCQPGLWDTSAAGHVDFGEAYDEAAERELVEELALDGVTLHRLWDMPAGADTGNEFVRVYACRTTAEPVPDQAEIVAGGWYKQAELSAWIAREPQRFTAAFRAIYARFCLLRPVVL